MKSLIVIWILHDFECHLFNNIIFVYLQKDRFRALNSLAKELVQGSYHAKDAVNKK
jgi:hypothetical protein